MNHHDRDEPFDRAMRDLHQQALSRVSAPTRARLRAARIPASRDRTAGRNLGWAIATGFAALFALAIGLQLHAPPMLAEGPPSVVRVAPQAGGSDTDAGVETLDENPDFYLWLASTDDAPPDSLER